MVRAEQGGCHRPNIALWESEKRASIHKQNRELYLALQSGLRDGSAGASVRKRPALFRALGDSDPPKSVSVSLGNGEYHVETVLKHDSWAATAVYSNLRGERIICKFNRTA